MAQNDCLPDQDRFQRAVSRLRPIEREILVLAAREGLRTDEIATHLGLASDTVERHLADALYNLDRLLERRDRPWWRFW